MKKVKCRYCKNDTIINKKCDKCGCITTNATITSIDQNKFFDDYSYNKYTGNILYKVYELWNILNVKIIFNNNVFYKILSIILSPIAITNINVNLKNKKNIIDVGCGKADFLLRAPKNLIKTGVEIVDYKTKGVNVFRINFEESSINNKYDIVRSVHSIEHAQNPKIFLNNLISITNSKGIIQLATPNADFWLINFFGKNWVPLNVDSHFCILSPDAIEKELKNNDFEILYIGTYSLFSHIESFIKKYRMSTMFIKYPIYLIFVILLYPLSIVEKLTKTSDSILIYAKKK